MFVYFLIIPKLCPSAILEIRLAPMGTSLTGLRMLEPPLGSPSQPLPGEKYVGEKKKERRKKSQMQTAVCKVCQLRPIKRYSQSFPIVVRI
jgi:hypothetical protein